MLQKRAYHSSAARGLVAGDRVEEAEKHLDAVNILTLTLNWES